MSASGKEVVRLCEQIVRQAFGDDVCRVASTLLNRGRLSAYPLHHLSGLPKPTVLAALVVLYQHGLVLSSGASLHTPDADEMYEFDTAKCMLRLRWGWILNLIREKLGGTAQMIVKQILLYGKLNLPSILRACGCDGNATRTIEVEEATVQLVRDNFLQPTHPEVQILLADMIDRRIASIVVEQKSSGGSSLDTTIGKENIRNRATYEVKGERANLLSIDCVLEIIEKGGRKKKSKADNVKEYRLRQEIPLQVNYDRFGVIMRDELIVKAAEDRWNRGAAEVVRAVLSASLDDHSELSNHRTLRYVTVTNIVEKLPPSANDYIVAGMFGTAAKSAADYVRQYLAVLCGEDVFSGSGDRFLYKQGGADPTYQVELEGICIKLRANLMMDLVRERLGLRSARILATVAKAHHISEQVIRDCAMIPLKEARVALAELQKMALIETSEQAKSAGQKRIGMTASSEHHSWSMDLPRAYTALLSNAYKTLGNILQRRAHEVEKHKNALGREAVAMERGLGREALQAKDQTDLAELDDVVRKLTLVEQRCEMVVFILRDLPGWPTSKLLGI